MANGFQTISSALNTHGAGYNNFKSPALSGGVVAVHCPFQRLSIRVLVDELIEYSGDRGVIIIVDRRVGRAYYGVASLETK